MLGDRVWVLPVEGLDELAGAVEMATEPVVPLAGRGPHRRRFRGHLTLARGRQRSSFTGLPSPELTYEWAVRDFGLIQSELRAEGAQHRVLRRWDL